MRLMVYHIFNAAIGRTGLKAMKDEPYQAAIEVVEYSNLLSTDESWAKKWAWIFRSTYQWHALGYIAFALCHEPNNGKGDRAWRAIGESVQRYKSHAHQHGKGLLWQNLRKTLARAKEIRESRGGSGHYFSTAESRIGVVMESGSTASTLDGSFQSQSVQTSVLPNSANLSLSPDEIGSEYFSDDVIPNLDSEFATECHAVDGLEHLSTWVGSGNASSYYPIDFLTTEQESDYTVGSQATRGPCRLNGHSNCSEQ